MDGVFINLTGEDVTINTGDKSVTIVSNTDLVTPIRKSIKTHTSVSGITSLALKDEEIYTLQSAQMFNTIYNKIIRTEQTAPLIKVELICPYFKYSFTQEQIDKINSISNGRTRLLIMTRDDAEFWSSGNFKENPFRNYRIFTVDENILTEYPIPTTYLDMISSSVSSVSKKFGF
jgi:hypothetical protein